MADPMQQCTEGSNVLAADAPKLSSAATEVSLATGAAGEGSTVAIATEGHVQNAEPRHDTFSTTTQAMDWHEGDDAGIDGTRATSSLFLPLTYSNSLQSGTDASASVLGTTNMVSNMPHDMNLSTMSATSQHPNLSPDVHPSVAPPAQTDETTGFGTNSQDLTFWTELDTLYQWPCNDFDFVFPEQELLHMAQDFLSPTAEFDDTFTGAPVPAFLGARSSPEPLEGRGVCFDEYVRKVFGSRYQLRNGASDGRTHTAHQRSRSASVPQLMGTFSPVLSSDQSGDLWQAEDLAHVVTLPQHLYDQIITRFAELNGDNGRYTPFAGGLFPSKSACNAFIQLFFEEFNPLFPILHRPTFAPASQHWLLLVALIATGCRFSRVSAAVDCSDLLQEFLRRAFLAMVSEDYSSTFEPWVVQAGLLNQIGMLFSKDLRLTQSAQSMRSLLITFARQVNCFQEPLLPDGSPDLDQSSTEAWKLYIGRESRRRLAFALWLVDSHFMMFYDLPPLVPVDLLRVRLPSSEPLWHASTVAAWLDCWKQGSSYLPFGIRRELKDLYSSGSLKPGLGDFALLLLIVGVYRNAVEIRGAFRDGSDLLSAAVNGPTMPTGEVSSLSDIALVNAKAMKFINILRPRHEHQSTLSSLTKAVIHHCHIVGMLLGITLREIMAFSGYRVTSTDIALCEDRLKVWVRDHGREAREVAIHAGRLFSAIRKSSMYGYYEGRALLVACQTLWIYGATADLLTPLPADGCDSERDVSSTIRLDQSLDKEAEESWLQRGETMRPCLAGVGSILGPDGVARLIHEGSRILRASRVWPLCDTMAKALKICHHLRVGKSIKEFE
ncbi:uncharacterized protein Z520_03887 [Fonsecaea multimorphosa CBS 102226]|uniref:Xylanolytic transcriptional activator regulatory domain-containing protein n=1 Tax=Fonsecaea multimorphosa CBS 102226 TaxID=1442371 RepID=A0A0D2ITB4_9EURO|nr:uncharacterized protein Z520_03887 [Fonsecaea multimorphosa CBS 102226]KIY00202.1 hypothetical protein Z520_03887 [Fonsecaea multimorphosa CBS 102226]